MKEDIRTYLEYFASEKSSADYGCLHLDEGNRLALKSTYACTLCIQFFATWLNVAFLYIHRPMCPH